MRAGTMAANGRVIHRGEYLTLDGSSGEVIAGRVPTVEAAMSPAFKKFMSWADAERKLGVRANADTPHDAAVAREFGAEGIGLCRTEHMFFNEDRITAVREMILAETSEQRAAALEKILPMQREDFVGILRAMAGLPVTIRLLDPPLHEFLPKGEHEIRELAARMGVSYEHLKQTCRQAVRVQPDAGPSRVAAGNHLSRNLSGPGPRDPGSRRATQEGRRQDDSGDHAAADRRPPRIRLPGRAKFAKSPDQVLGNGAKNAEVHDRHHDRAPARLYRGRRYRASAEFFSFGTNDLTQMTYGLSRDDSVKFLDAYLERGIYKRDPFQELDPDGVGDLMRIAIERGRKANKSIKLGICGEHGGDPASIKLCHRLGLDYVSCSPFRVPVARLAAAQAAIEVEKRASANSRTFSHFR